jgi:hypothetical protein
VAITGLLLTVILLDRIPEWLTLTVFVAMGWSALVSMLKAWKLYGLSSVVYAFYGGMAYSVGAAIDFTRILNVRPGVFGPHEIFHLLVIAGAFLHWLFIYRWANQPTRDRLVFMVKEQSDETLWAKAVGENYQVRATSKKDLRNKVREMLSKHVHPRLIPQRVRFRFYKDILIQLPQ